MTDDDKDGDDAREDGGGDWKKSARGDRKSTLWWVFCSLTPVYDAQRARFFAARRDAPRAAR